MEDRLRYWLDVVRDAGIVLAVSAGAALSVNGLRADGLPLIATVEYDILVPCPELDGEVTGVQADCPCLSDPDNLLVDARDPEARREWAIDSALSIPFDWLEPAPPEMVRKLLRAKAASIVVFGDGGDPDTGEQLARELAGRGVRNLLFVRGGAPAIRAIREGGGR